MYLTHYNDLAWVAREKSGSSSPRTARPATLLKLLCEGTKGQPGYFEAVVSRYPVAKSYPRHRHRVDQFRYTLTGASPWGPGRATPTGSLVYIPAGTFYGPYERPPGVELMAVQFEAASGVPFAAEPIDESDSGHSSESGSGAPVEIDPERLEWRQRSLGHRDKRLGNFADHDVRILMLGLDAGCSADLGSAHRSIAFVTHGRGRTGDEGLSERDAVFLDANERIDLTGIEEFEVLVLELPRLISSDS